MRNLFQKIKKLGTRLMPAFLGVFIFFILLSLSQFLEEKREVSDSTVVLKKQVEEELKLFTKIKKAHLLFDLPGKIYPGKASVVLSLKKDAELTEMELLAICYHISAAIADLDITQIAISDTEGRLYKKQDTAFFMPPSSKDLLSKRVQTMLEKSISKKYYLFCIQEDPLSVHFLFDERFQAQKNFLPFLTKQMKIIDPEISLSIDWTLFQKTRKLPKIAWAIVIFFLISFGGIYGIKKTREQKQSSDEKLAELIKDQPPKTLAILLSYLEPGKAKKILDALPIATQEAIAHHFRTREG